MLSPSTCSVEIGEALLHVSESDTAPLAHVNSGRLCYTFWNDEHSIAVHSLKGSIGCSPELLSNLNQPKGPSIEASMSADESSRSPSWPSSGKTHWRWSMSNAHIRFDMYPEPANSHDANSAWMKLFLEGLSLSYESIPGEPSHWTVCIDDLRLVNEMPGSHMTLPLSWSRHQSHSLCLQVTWRVNSCLSDVSVMLESGPIRLYLDPCMLSFLASWMPSNCKTVPFVPLSKVDVRPIELTVDYEPPPFQGGRPGYRVLWERLCLLKFHESTIHLRHIQGSAIQSWSALERLFIESWAPDVSSAHLIAPFDKLVPISARSSSGTDHICLLLVPISEDGNAISTGSAMEETMQYVSQFCPGTPIHLEPDGPLLGGSMQSSWSGTISSQDAQHVGPTLLAILTHQLPIDRDGPPSTLHATPLISV